jgi:hypothetical protein
MKGLGVLGRTSHDLCLAGLADAHCISSSQLSGSANLSPHSVEVRVRVGGSIVVDDDIHLLNVNTTPKDTRSDQDPLLKVLKLLGTSRY